MKDRSLLLTTAMVATKTDKLLEAMGSLSLSSNIPNENNPLSEKETSLKNDTEIDLEKLFLTPDHRFSGEWLNKLQEYPLP